jgi:hypothetical protein
MTRSAQRLPVRGGCSTAPCKSLSPICLQSPGHLNSYLVSIRILPPLGQNRNDGVLGEKLRLHEFGGIVRPIKVVDLGFEDIAVWIFVIYRCGGSVIH